MRFFLIGTGRCGSTLLQKMLDVHPDLFVFPETHWIPNLVERFGRDPQPLSAFVEIVNRTHHVTGKSTTELPLCVQTQDRLLEKLYTIPEFCNLVGQGLAKEHGKTVWADKTPDYGAYIPELQELWPECKFIHLIRDGVEVSRSMSYHPGFQVMVNEGETNWVPLSLDYSPSQYVPSDEPRDYIDLWCKRVTEIKLALNSVSSNNQIEVRFEELIDNPAKTLQKICVFTGLKADSDWIEKASKTIDKTRLVHPPSYFPFFDAKELNLQASLGYQKFNLELVSEQPKIEAGDILLVACVRNETLRIAAFHKYYKDLGVDKFLFIDNGSDDGTVEFLLEQGSTYVFSTEDSYADSRCGITWTNEILRRYADKHWTVVVDADEHFTYPRAEFFDLKKLSSYLDESKANAMSAPLLDMYSNTPIIETNYRAGKSLLRACPYFDSDSYSDNESNSRDSSAISNTKSISIERGGPRDRLFWKGRDHGHMSPFLYKIPFVKWKKEFAFTMSTHQLDGANLPDISGLLLHFKFLQDFSNRAEIEVHRKEHFADARQYAAYSEVLSSDRNITAYYEGSHKYQNTTQLVNLGLMNMPKDYEYTHKVTFKKYIAYVVKMLREIVNK